MSKEKKNYIRKPKANGTKPKKGKYHEVFKIDATFEELMQIAAKGVKKTGKKDTL